MSNSSYLLTVYYDEMCVLCSAEINHYKKQVNSDKINFVDITSSNFDAKKEKVDPFEVHKVMHAKDQSGKLLKKMDAFIAIWKILPKYKWLYNISQRRFNRQFMDFGYFLFAKARPYLPKKGKASDCEASPYCELKNK